MIHLTSRRLTLNGGCCTSGNWALMWTSERVRRSHGSEKVQQRRVGLQETRVVSVVERTQRRTGERSGARRRTRSGGSRRRLNRGLTRGGSRERCLWGECRCGSRGRVARLADEAVKFEEILSHERWHRIAARNDPMWLSSTTNTQYERAELQN